MTNRIPEIMTKGKSLGVAKVPGDPEYSQPLQTDRGIWGEHLQGGEWSSQ